ncbi:MAG TPA: STAS domain-containing protein [Actinomycetota bacterium]|nr:STAS domain-containing protein [Actinomycetota bacterium]
MTLEVEHTGDTFRLKGELDIAAEEALMQALEPELEAGREVILDLGGLEFIDSSGVRCLIRAANAVGSGGRVVLRDPLPPVRRVFELMRVDTIPNVAVEPSGGSP